MTTISARRAEIAKGSTAFLLPYSSDLGRDGVVSIVGAEQPTNRGMIPRRARYFDLLHSMQTDSGAQHPPTQWTFRALQVADHPPPLSATVKNEWSYTSS